MGHTFRQLLCHSVFATRGRRRLVTPDMTEALHAIIGSVVRDAGGVLFAAGGTRDHVHLLLRHPPRVAIADIMREAKAVSSKWARQTLGVGAFGWQEGYSAFSVSQSAKGKVEQYIRGQEEHHLSQTFEQELRKLLQLHGIEFDERHLE